MSVQPFLWLIALLCVISASVIFWVAEDYRFMTGFLAAAIFVSGIGGIALQVNKPYWTGEFEPLNDEDGAITASRNNAHLLSLTFAWGAIVMIAAYFLTDLYWYHAWQYASIMVLLTGALAGYAYLISTKNHVLRTPKALKFTAALAALQAIATVVGLIFLITSGKLYAGRSDWVANIVFVCGGSAIIIISTLAAATQARIRRA